MKRFSCLICALLLLLSCASFVSAKDFSIAEGKQIAIAVDDVSVNEGSTGTISVPVSVKFADGFSGIIGFTVKFTYDTTRLVFDKAKSTFAAEVPGASVKSISENSKKTVTFQQASTGEEGSYNTDGLLFTMVFTLAEGAEEGDAAITFSSVTFPITSTTKADASSIDGKVTVVGKTKYTVTFDNNGHGTAPESKTVVEGSQITLPSMENDGYYIFTGWSNDTAVLNAGDPYTVNAAVSFTAQWNDTTPSHTVTYDTNGHGDPPPSATVREGDKITLPTLSDEGYIKFAGWKEENGTQTYTGEYTVTKEVLLIAQWNDTTPSWTVSFDTNGHGPAALTPTTVKEGTTVYLPILNNDGYYVFTGWKLGETFYRPNDSYTPTSSVTFVAQWNDTTPEYTVAFDTNGHGEQQESQTVKEGTSITLPRLPRDGAFRFVGWKCSDDDEIHAGGSTFVVMKADTLTAQWQEAANTDAAVTPKSLYNKYSKAYTVDVYFSGAAADSVAFGFAYSADLTFEGFVPADGYANLEPLTTNENGVFATVVTVDGSDAAYIDATEEEVLLGTIKFTFTGAEFVEGMAGERIRTATIDDEDGVYEGGYFVFAEHADGLDVYYDPLNVEDNTETIQELPTVDVTGSVKILRASTDAPKNFAQIRFYDEDDQLVLEKTIENANTRTDANGEFTYTVNITIGHYYVVVSKSGYKTEKSEVFDVPVEGETVIETLELVAGDTADSTAATAGDGVIDLIDFARIKRAFTPDITADQLIVCDINEDGAVNVEDLNIIKTNFGK